MDDNGILKQCRIENEALDHTKDALLAMIAWPVEGKMFTRKLSGLRFLVRWFQQQVERLFAIEEHDGYMDMAVEAAPYLAGKIQTLQSEHVVIQRLLSEVATRLDRTLPDDLPTFESLCEDLKSALRTLDKHLQSETKLVQEAMSQDLGGESGA